ncbi:hypothetical protein INR49_003284 [Caranx melampygus]|nr:hypothetical protein INR49_003284 [Caranx melampygus]
MDGVSGTQHQEYSNVFLGSNFTISCSIQSQYPGGIFQLTFNSSRTMHSYIQLAVNHSTTFLFPAAEPAHQGSYSCVYQVYVSSHDFSSESHQLSLTVTVKKLLVTHEVLLFAKGSDDSGALYCLTEVAVNW